MLKDAIEKILGLAQPNYHFPHQIKNDDGEQAIAYTDKSLNIIMGPAYPTINASTLMALKQFIDADYLAGDDRLIHVVSPQNVRYIGGERPDGSRNVFCNIKLDLGFEPRFNQYHGLQSFMIHLQTDFVPNASTASLLEFLSSIVVGESGQFEDKGVFQSVNVKSGITTVEHTQITPRVELKPFRTFTEVDQPESTFLFRLKATNEARNIECALFNCDANAWRPVAMQRVAKWISENVEHKIPILA